MAQQYNNLAKDERNAPSTELIQLHGDSPNNGDDAVDTKQSYSIVFQTVVPSAYKEYFEQEWLPGIYETVSSYKGFLYRTVHLMTANKRGFCEYAIILAFDSIESMNAWVLSEDRRLKIKEIIKRGGKTYRYNEYGGVAADLPDQLSGEDQKSGGKVLKRADSFTGLNISSTRIQLQDTISLLPRPMPPAKWKLYLVILLAIYSTVTIVGIGGSPQKMLKAGVPLGMVVFVGLLHITPLSAFAVIPLIMATPIVSWWIRRPRCPPAEMSPAYSLVDQGLQIFAVDPPPVASPEMIARVDRLEGRLDKLRLINHTLSQGLENILLAQKKQQTMADGYDSTENSCIAEQHISIDMDKVMPGEEMDTLDDNKETDVEQGLFDEYEEQTVINQTIDETLDELASLSARKSVRNLPLNEDDTKDHVALMTGSPAFNALNDHKAPLTMVVRHYVKWERVPEFEEWTDKMDAEMRKFPGFQGFHRIAPDSDNDPYVNSFTFDTLENFIKFRSSKKRLELLRQLEPMLESTSVAELNQERVIRDALSELFVSTGGAAQSRPPPVWKTVVLTIIPLHIIIWLAGLSVQGMLVSRHVPFLLASFLSIAMNVALNVYVGVPLMHLQFGHWLRKECPKEGSFGCQALKFLDTGIPFWAQVAAVVVHYSLNLSLGLTGS